MADVTFLFGLEAEYNAVESKDSNTLYFLEDKHKIMKGDIDFTDSVIFVDTFPSANQIQGKLYISGKTGKVWVGSGWNTVFEQAIIPPIVNDLTTGGTDKTLSAEQGKLLKATIDSHSGTLGGTASGHVKTGGDVEITAGLITVKKIGGVEWSNIKSGIDSAIDAKAPKANPTFTGTVTVPTPTADGAAATKGYVDSKIAANDAMRFKGTLGTGGSITALPTAYRIGDTYRVITAGTYAGVACEIGDLLIAMVTKESGGTNADWTVAQTNIDGAVVGPASSTDATVVLFDGTSGKKIKGSAITLTVLQNAITNAHTHANKAKLDTYDKTQAELLSTAQGYVNTHASIMGSASTAGHLKLGTTAADAAAGNHNHTFANLLGLDLSGLDNGFTIYYDKASNTWKTKAIATVDISGKLDKVTSNKTDEIITANTDGTIKASGKKIGGGSLAASPNANTLATEAAVREACNNVKIQWGTIQ